MPPQDPQLLDYEPMRRVRPRLSRPLEFGICAGIIAFGISSTFGSAEGRDGFVTYLYPGVVPVLDYVFGSNSDHPVIEGALYLLYWPLVGVAAHVLFASYQRRRRGKMN